MAPTVPTLVFDGDCGFCTRTAMALARRFPVVEDLVPWQRADLRWLGVTLGEARRSVQWVEPSGRVYPGAAAVARVLVRTGGGWAVVGRLMAVPPGSWVAAVVYRLIARNRHRMPGGVTPACDDPSWAPPRSPSP
jgi:predicted DCC family thiol-disulfide oxidoreductase YuxK